jgi:S-DNA-T family DNA segregation ATPase FtsK/SpoIIIE
MDEPSKYEPKYETDNALLDSMPEPVTEKTKITKEANEEELQEEQIIEEQPKKEYMLPPLNLLKKGEGSKGDTSIQLKETALRLQQTLQNFGVKVTITDISQGPSVTRYEMQPEQGVKVSKIVGLADDIKLNLAATDIRIEAPIPGKAAVGIEVPNKENSTVALRDLLEANEFQNFQSNLAFAVGKDIGGQVVVTDIAKMPHVLIAGATGSGKSVCINTIIMSILYKANPEDVKLIMIDPKVVELSVYNGIPHLMIPVVTDPKKASAALNWGVTEMNDRYRKFADLNVRDLKGYNKAAEMGKLDADGQPIKKLPQIVIIVDELADLMMVASNEVEESICRLAQLARACGIHLVIATQRPSVDVITGLIKANMPSRIAFSVSSGVDSRTILDMNGAEKLLGKGDMLFYPQGYSKPARVQGAFVSDSEVSDVVDFLKNQMLGNVSYNTEIEDKIKTMQSSGSGSLGASGSGSDLDAYFVDAGKFVIEKDKASIGMLQRVFKIGFNRAARIVDQLEDAGVVGAEEGTKPRRILMSLEQFENYVEENV